MKKNALLAGILVLFMVVLSGCSIPQVPNLLLSASSATPVPTVTPAVVSPGPSVGAIAALEGTLEQIYEQVNPSVVNVRVVQTQEIEVPAVPEIPGFQFPFPVPQGPQVQQGLGSGFVWDEDGHIITNNHVVDGADKITITFYDGTTVPGEVVGADADSDLAVVQADVPAEQLHPVQVADSAQVKVGELVVAIGNPFGLEGTMTVGIVSALGRSLPVESGALQGARYTIPDIIQTDAPINPGNSGGVLVDDAGRVVGVTAAIESPTRASAGIGFAIPSAIVRKVVPVLIDSGHYDHPWVGISGTSLTPELAGAMGLEANQRGGLVLDVVPDSPADQAGLRGSDRQVEVDGQTVRVGGDLVVAVDGQPVREFDDLIAYLARDAEVGQTLTLTVLRGNREQAVGVTLAARPTSDTERGQQQERTSRGAYLGIVGLSLTPDIAEALDLPADQEGVLVEQVQQGSPADEAGLRGSYKPVTINGQQMLVGGDVVTALDGQPVNGMEDLQALLRQVEPGQKATLTVLREGKKVRVNVALGEQPASRP
jgi:serine protease Do